jgi:hypothetical protein
MKVSELKEVLRHIPGDTEVLIDGNHGLSLEADCKTGFCSPINEYGQAFFIEDPYSLAEENRAQYSTEAILLTKARW